MKKKIFYAGVIAMAMTLSAFSVAKKPAGNSLYWFPLLSNGHPKTVNDPIMVYLPYDPAACVNWGFGDYCSAGFTSYSGTSAPYFAAGFEVLIDYYYY